mgnify:CR=1 FL=1
MGGGAVIHAVAIGLSQTQVDCQTVEAFVQQQLLQCGNDVHTVMGERSMGDQYSAIFQRAIIGDL